MRNYARTDHGFRHIRRSNPDVVVDDNSVLSCIDLESDRRFKVPTHALCIYHHWQVSSPMIFQMLPILRSRSDSRDMRGMSVELDFCGIRAALAEYMGLVNIPPIGMAVP
jgi:hypothetical protein